jgi:hypothetical protein
MVIIYTIGMTGMVILQLQKIPVEKKLSSGFCKDGST